MLNNNTSSFNNGGMRVKGSWLLMKTTLNDPNTNICHDDNLRDKDIDEDKGLSCVYSNFPYVSDSKGLRSADLNVWKKDLDAGDEPLWVAEDLRFDVTVKYGKKIPFP